VSVAAAISGCVTRHDQGDVTRPALRTRARRGPSCAQEPHPRLGAGLCQNGAAGSLRFMQRAGR